MKEQRLLAMIKTMLTKVNLDTTSQEKRQELLIVAIKKAGYNKNDLHLVPYDIVKMFRVSEKDA